MTDSPRSYYPSTLSKKLVNTRVSWTPYLSLGIVINMAIWGLTFVYLKATLPVYRSNWTLTLPGAASSTNVNVAEMGGAYSQAVSPYANQSQDPRENYKFILTSQPVQKAAAAKLKMSTEEFGQPKIKILANTTLMNIELSGGSPDEAQKKSLALSQAFQARLDELRTQEVAQRDANVQTALSDARKKLENSQKRFSDYQVRSGLASNTQIEQLSSQIEDLRKQRAEIVAQQKESSVRLRQLSTNLNVTAQQVSDALILKADQLFQQHLKNYSEATSTLTVLNSKYLPNHPAVVRQQSLQKSAKAALLARSQFLLGHPTDQATLAQLNIGDNAQSGSARETLFQELIKAQGDQQGFEASAQELGRQIAQLETRLKTQAEYGSTLEALRRDLQISETVFSSTVAKLDVDKSNMSGSYPEIQLLTDPSLPDSPSSPKKKFVLLGAVLGSFFSTSGLVTLWLRKRKT